MDKKIILIPSIRYSFILNHKGFRFELWDFSGKQHIERFLKYFKFHKRNQEVRNLMSQIVTSKGGRQLKITLQKLPKK